MEQRQYQPGCNRFWWPAEWHSLQLEAGIVVVIVAVVVMVPMFVDGGGGGGTFFCGHKVKKPASDDLQGTSSSIRSETPALMGERSVRLEHTEAPNVNT